jgi:HTH-type transcriptional regulator/antitoxin MqsA
MTTAPLCPETSLPMVRDTRPMTISYKGASATIAMPGWYCDQSGESIHTGSDMRVSDAALRELKNKVDLLDGAEIRRIRKKIGLTQREAGAIFGGGPNAFQKYEQGAVTVSKAMSNLLRVLEKHPDAVEELKKYA